MCKAMITIKKEIIKDMKRDKKQLRKDLKWRMKK